MAVKDENYIVIQGWMINRLNLKGNDLLIYALIYGFSQDGTTPFIGNVNYIADFVCCSKKTVKRSLDYLVNSELIIKEPYEINNVVFNKYRAKCHRGGQNDPTPGVKMTPNNNINKNIQEKEIYPPKGVYISQKKDQIQQVIDAWNSLGVTQITAIKPNTQRYNALNARIKEYGEDGVINTIRRAANSSFLMGKNKNNWQITFDWLITSSNFIKVYEGNYDDKEKQGDPFMSELKRIYDEADENDEMTL